MIKQPLISIIVPIYNVEDYLPVCIDSILRQSYKNLEIILVDDGSTDNCYKICEYYKNLDNRIIVIHKENGGLSDARNSGVTVARGEYISFVDSDDEIEKDIITYLYDKISVNDVDMSVCQWANIDENGQRLFGEPNFKDILIDGNENCMKELLTNTAFNTCAWGKLYKKEILEGIYYPKGKYHEDVFTTYLIVAKCRSIYIGKERKYNYRTRKSSICNRKFEKKHLDLIYGSLKRDEFIRDNYSSLITYSSASIVSATNNIMLKMAKSNFYDIEILNWIQDIYRKYGFYLLRQKRRLIIKLFTIIGILNSKLLYKLIRISIGGVQL